MDKFNSYKIKQFQIIQHDKTHVEVLIVIDEALRTTGISVDKLLEELQNRFSERIGSGVLVSVRETDAIQKDARSDYVRVVVSKVKPREFSDTL